MNIKNFKNIDELIATKEANIGQLIDQKTLDLISKGLVPITLPGGTVLASTSCAPDAVMEFVLYDSANNIIEQNGYGMARYIQYSEFSKYLIPSTNQTDTTTQGGGYVVDAKTLINEAGFTTGYFRIQVTFLRNRVGSHIEYDKVFVQEISPSREEIRLLPYPNKSVSADPAIVAKLTEEYDTFVDGKFPIDETGTQQNTLLSDIKMANGLSIIAPPDSTTPEGQFLTELQKEFGTDAATIIQNVISGITLPAQIGTSNCYISKQEILDAILNSFKLNLDAVLPKRNLVNNAIYNTLAASAVDNLGNVVQTLQLNTDYQLPNIQRVTLNPNQSGGGPGASTTAFIDTTLNTSVTVIPPTINFFELTSCTDPTKGITGKTTHINTYGVGVVFLYQGVCYSISAARETGTLTYIAKNLNLDSLANYGTVGGNVAQACVDCAFYSGNTTVGGSTTINPNTGWTVNITGPTVQNLLYNYAVVVWGTDVATIGTLFFTSIDKPVDQLTGQPMSMYIDNTAGTAHSAQFAGLLPNTTYTFYLEVYNPVNASNLARTLEQSFTTPAAPIGATTTANPVTVSTISYLLANCVAPLDTLTGVWSYYNNDPTLGGAPPNTGVTPVVFNIAGNCYQVTGPGPSNVTNGIGVTPLNNVSNATVSLYTYYMTGTACADCAGLVSTPTTAAPTTPTTAAPVTTLPGQNTGGSGGGAINTGQTTLAPK